MKRTGSRRSPPPTRCSATPNKRRIVDAGGDPLAGPGSGGFGGGGLGDIFEQFFGGGTFGGGGRGPRSRVQPGEPALVHVTLDLARMRASGVNKEITVDTAILWRRMCRCGHQRQPQAGGLRHLPRGR